MRPTEVMQGRAPQKGLLGDLTLRRFLPVLVAACEIVEFLGNEVEIVCQGGLGVVLGQLLEGSIGDKGQNCELDVLREVRKEVERRRGGLAHAARPMEGIGEGLRSHQHLQQEVHDDVPRRPGEK